MPILTLMKPLILLVALAVILRLLPALVRARDEREVQILSRAALHTLLVTAVAASLCGVRNLLERDAPAWSFGPFEVLTWLAACFAVELLFWRRRYGG